MIIRLTRHQIESFRQRKLLSIFWPGPGMSTNFQCPQQSIYPYVILRDQFHVIGLNYRAGEYLQCLENAQSFIRCWREKASSDNAEILLQKGEPFSIQGRKLVVLLVVNYSNSNICKYFSFFVCSSVKWMSVPFLKNN